MIERRARSGSTFAAASPPVALHPQLKTALLAAAAVLVPLAIAIGVGSGDEVLVLGIVVAAVASALILALPFWGMVFWIALMYVRPEDWYPSLGTMRISLVIALVVLAGVWVRLFVRHEQAARSPVIGMTVGFAAATVLSTLAAGGNPLDAADSMAKIVVLVVLILNLVRTPREYRVFANTLVTFCVYLALFAAHRYFAGQVVDTGTEARATAGGGVFGDPNDLAATISVGLALLVTRIPSARWPARIAYLTTAAVLAWGILLTASRGGMLAMLVAIGGGLVLASRRRYVAVAIFAVVALGLWSAGHGHMTDFSSQEASANSRFQFWNVGVSFLVGHPLLGIGMGQFAVQNYISAHGAHNTFVMCFAETGLLGYFFWMGALYYAFRRRPRPTDADRADDRGDALGARLALATYLTAVFFLNHTYDVMLFVLICLPLLQQRIAAPGATAARRSGAERFRECLQIAALCVGSIAAIKLMAWRLA